MKKAISIYVPKWHFSFAYVGVIAFMVLSLQACTKELGLSQDGQTSRNETLARAGKPTAPVKLTAVPVRVSVNSTTGYGITSDNGTDYVHGSQNVSATIDEAGNFIFNSIPSRKSKDPTVRYLNYNLGTPLQVFTQPPSVNNCQGTFIATIKSDLQGTFIPLQSMAVNGVQCTTWSGNLVSNGTNNYRLNFHRGLDDTNDSPTAYAVVTRTSATSWNIASVGSCSANSNIGALRNDNTPTTLYGYYNVPFQFTLTAL